MNFGYYTQKCEYLSNKRLILFQKGTGILSCLLTIEESNDNMWQRAAQEKMCARGLQNKMSKVPDVQ